jgi:hypothetical protein
MRNISTLSLVFLTALVACGPSNRGDDGVGGGDDGGGSDGGSQETRACNKMDIVFVVDDSASMEQEQSNLATNFPMFASAIQAFTTSAGEHLDFRIGITTTGRDLHYAPVGPITLPDEHGPNGAFEMQAGCGANRWLDNTDAMLSHDLACRANVGIAGASQEMPLLMTKRAVVDRIADNTQTGFVRPDALLAVVMITDEDDSSNTMDGTTVPLAGLPIDWNPADTITALDTLKGGRTRWAAAAIAGDGDCQSAFGDAVDAKRLKNFVLLANSNGTTQAVFSSICDGDLTIGLTKALMTFQNACNGIIL